MDTHDLLIDWSLTTLTWLAFQNDFHVQWKHDGLWPTWPHLLLWQWERLFSPLAISVLLCQWSVGSSQLILAGMRLLRLAHSILDHPLLVLWFLARVSGLLAGGLGSVAGLALVWLCFWCFRWSRILSCSCVSLFHLQNCTCTCSCVFLLILICCQILDQAKMLKACKLGCFKKKRKKDTNKQQTAFFIFTQLRFWFHVVAHGSLHHVTGSAGHPAHSTWPGRRRLAMVIS